jgi:hypothetical protein
MTDEPDMDLSLRFYSFKTTISENANTGYANDADALGTMIAAMLVSLHTARNDTSSGDVSPFRILAEGITTLKPYAYAHEESAFVLAAEDFCDEDDRETERREEAEEEAAKTVVQAGADQIDQTDDKARNTVR